MGEANQNEQATPTKKVTSGDIRAALVDRFPTSSHALMFEVGNGTGHKTSRHADAVVMGLWPSRGLEVEGVEIKVSRQDWLNELKQPEKAEAVAQYCDRWWIAAPAGMVKPDELPASWGLLELPEGKALRIKVQAPKLTPKDLDRSFVAAMLRRASEADAGMVDRLVAKKLEGLRARDAEELERKIGIRTQKAEEGMKKIAEIEKELGFSLSGWTTSADIAAAIKFAMKSGLVGKYGTLESFANSADAMAKEIRKFTSELKEG